MGERASEPDAQPPTRYSLETAVAREGEKSRRCQDTVGLPHNPPSSDDHVTRPKSHQWRAGQLAAERAERQELHRDTATQSTFGMATVCHYFIRKISAQP